MVTRSSGSMNYVVPVFQTKKEARISYQSKFSSAVFPIENEGTLKFTTAGD